MAAIHRGLAKAARRVFLILLAAIVLVVFGLSLAQDQETLKIRSPVGAEDPRFAAYIAALVGADVNAGNHFHVLANGDRFFPPMLAAIDAARERIVFETYIYESGTIGRRFAEAFAAAARRGVRVIIVVDAVGASAMAADDLRLMTDAGCIVASFNMPRWYSLENINYRTHRKLLVVDGDVGFTGGAGIDDQWLGNAENPERWRDTIVRMQGPIVRLLEAAFYENYIEAGGVVSPALETYPPPPVDQTGPALVVRSGPTGGSNDLKRLYLLSIAAARRTLDIVSPYFITDESSIWSLEDATKRGVKIRILTEGRITDAMPVKYASRAAYERLLEMGIEVYEYQPTMLHAKVLVVDSTWSMFGSANFDNRSLELNDELNVAVWDRELASGFVADMGDDLKVSERLDLTTWRKRSALEKTRERFWSWFGEVF